MAAVQMACTTVAAQTAATPKPDAKREARSAKLAAVGTRTHEVEEAVDKAAEDAAARTKAELAAIFRRIGCKETSEEGLAELAAFNVKSVADLLGMKRSDVNNHIHRGIARLRADHFDDPLLTDRTTQSQNKEKIR